MKIKKIGFILVLVGLAVMLAVHCGKDDPTGENQKAPEISRDDKIVLIINEKQYNNKHVKNFISSRHPGLTITEKSAKLVSRIFDTFVEHKMIMYSVVQNNVPIDQMEIDTYFREKRLPQDKKGQQAVIDSVKAQKFLYLRLYKDIDVTDAEIREHYNKNLEEYRRSSEVFLHQIVVKDRNKALDIRKTLLNSPGKFEQTAKEQSIAMEAQNGGNMGYFEKGTLPKDMERVVFALSLDKLSPVVESPYGYHIFKVTKIKKERLLYFDTVKGKIKNSLLSDKLRWAYEDFLVQLRKQLNVGIKYQSLFFNYQPVKGDNNDKNIQNNGFDNTGND